MSDALTTTQRVVPSLALDSRNRLVAVVFSDVVVGVCLKRLGSEVLDGATYTERLKNETWATLVRSLDGSYFVTACGLTPMGEEVDPSLLAKPETAEAIQMAIEIGLCVWPEWGRSLRSRYRPTKPLLLQLGGEAIWA